MIFYGGELVILSVSRRTDIPASTTAYIAMPILAKKLLKNKLQNMMLTHLCL